MACFLPNLSFALTQETGMYYGIDNLTAELKSYIDATSSIDILNAWQNLHYPGGGYYQTQLWFDSFGSFVCGPVYGPISYEDGFATQNTDSFSLAGHTAISQTYRLSSDSNAVDGDGCLNDPNHLEYDEMGGYNNLFYIGLPSSGSGSSTNSTTTVFVGSFDPVPFELFLGVFLFLCGFFGMVWLIRKH